MLKNKNKMMYLQHCGNLYQFHNGMMTAVNFIPDKCTFYYTLEIVNYF